MKIVVALPYAPWPVTKGLDRLVMNLLAGLSARHEVVLVTMALDRAQLGRLAEIETPRVAVRAFVAPNKRSAFHRAWYKARNAAAMLCAGVPMQVSYAAPPELLRLVADTADGERADLVLASYWHLYRLPEYVDPSKLVLVTMDLDFLVHPGRIERASHPAARARESARTKLLERIELEAYSRFGAILTVTEVDAETLRRHPVAAGKTIRALPLALDLSYFDAGAFTRERNRVLFPGAFHADFNRDALRYLLEEVWPLVRRESAEATLEIVGQGVEEGARAAAGEGAIFTGAVDDIRPRLGRCSVLVLPLRFGGGVRIRMMEAAAMGTAVVSTPVGVAGMGLEAGEQYLEAADARGMADAIVRLLADPLEAQRLGASARRWAERSISMETYPERLESILAELAAGR